MANLPERMRAVKIASLGSAAVENDAAVPQAPEGYLLIKTSHVALNPSDWKHIDYEVLCKPGYTLGFDACGTIVGLGANVGSEWAVGQRVAGPSWCARPGQPDSGSFGEYCVIKSHLVVRVPEGYSDAQAATLGVGSLTTVRALYTHLALPLPDPDSPPAQQSQTLLVHGASSATGLFATQFAKLSGYRVVATCSPRNFDKVKGFGADEVFDYSDADKCAAAIFAATGGTLALAFDCAAQGQSAKICAEALTKDKGKAQYVSLLPVADFPRAADDVTHHTLMVLPCWGEELKFGDHVFPAEPAEAAFAAKFIKIVQRLLEAGRIKTFESVRDGGLQGVIDGLDQMRKGRVSGQKLVYKI